ncbi:hypothetical protein GX48_00095 [Paracoccidioides brasiliensis]|nr:hypothetical protein GX48_00095 [Paracoccidioides brasiliensis]
MRVEELLNGGWMKWKLDKLCKKEKSGDDDGRRGGGGGRCVICVLWREVEVEGRNQTLEEEFLLTYESNQSTSLFSPLSAQLQTTHPWRSMKRLYSQHLEVLNRQTLDL